jgi:hypothetical protein
VEYEKFFFALALMHCAVWKGGCVVALDPSSTMERRMGEVSATEPELVST